MDNKIIVIGEPHPNALIRQMIENGNAVIVNTIEEAESMLEQLRNPGMGIGPDHIAEEPERGITITQAHVGGIIGRKLSLATAIGMLDKTIVQDSIPMHEFKLHKYHQVPELTVADYAPEYKPKKQQNYKPYKNKFTKGKR